MPRKYNPSKRGHYGHDHAKMQLALDAVKNGMSIRKAAEKYEVPKSTLSDKKSGKSEIGVKSGRKPFLDENVEQEIVSKVSQAAEMGFGMSKRQVLLKVGTLCQKTSVAHFKHGAPGKDWWYSFTKRHPEISLRKPEKLGNVRARMLNRVKVEQHFDDLEKLIDELNLREKPECIWNADESGKQFQHTPVKVVAKKGSRGVVGRTSDDRSNITLMACGNAAGNFMPPMLIVKGKTSKSLYGYNTAEAPDGTAWTFQENAWINENIALEWFHNVFLAQFGSHRPQILIMDGHGSHESAGIIQTAIENGITLYALPPHTTHFLQPLDRSVFGPFNNAYDFACTEFLSARTCNMVNKWTFPALFKQAWDSGMTASNMMNGFRACGIYPTNRKAIPDEAYAPSMPFDTPLEGSAPIEASNPQPINEHQNPLPLADPTTADVPPPLTCNTPLTLGDTTDAAISLPLAAITSADTPSTSTGTPLPLASSTSADNPFTSAETPLPLVSSTSAGTPLPLTSSTSAETPLPLASSTSAGTPLPLASSSSTDTCDYMDVDNPVLLLDLIKRGKIDVVATADENGVAELPTCDWSTELEALFLPSQITLPPQPKQSRRKITSHGILTSREILDEKLKIKEEKERKEQIKKERLEKRTKVTKKKA